MNGYKKNNLGSASSIAVISFILISLTIGVVFLWPNFQELLAVQEKIETKKIEIKGKENYLLSLSDAKSKLDEHKEEISIIDFALPNKPFLPSLFNHIQEKSSESGLILREVGMAETVSTEDSPDFQETVINIDLTGSYSSLKSFLSSLEKSARLVRIENISFSSDEDESFFDFSLKMKIYSYTNK